MKKLAKSYLDVEASDEEGAEEDEEGETVESDDEDDDEEGDEGEQGKKKKTKAQKKKDREDEKDRIRMSKEGEIIDENGNLMQIDENGKPVPLIVDDVSEGEGFDEDADEEYVNAKEVRRHRRITDSEEEEAAEEERKKYSAMAEPFLRSGGGLDGKKKSKKKKEEEEEEEDEDGEEENKLKKKIIECAVDEAVNRKRKHESKVSETNPKIGKEIDENLMRKMITWDVVTNCFEVCYKGIAQARKPFDAYLASPNAKGFLDLKREIKRSRDKADMERDRNAIIAMFAGRRDSPKKKSKKAAAEVPPTAGENVLQKLAHRVLNATKLEFAAAPEKSPTDGIVHNVAPGYAVKPNVAVICTMEFQSEPPTSVIVGPNVALLLERAHRIVMVDSFIKHSKPVADWCQDETNRKIICDGSVTLWKIEKDMAPFVAGLWKEWSEMREKFYATF